MRNTGSISSPSYNMQQEQSRQRASVQSGTSKTFKSAAAILLGLSSAVTFASAAPAPPNAIFAAIPGASSASVASSSAPPAASPSGARSFAPVAQTNGTSSKPATAANATTVSNSTVQSNDVQQVTLLVPVQVVKNGTNETGSTVASKANGTVASSSNATAVPVIKANSTSPITNVTIPVTNATLVGSASATATKSAMHSLSIDSSIWESIAPSTSALVGSSSALPSAVKPTGTLLAPVSTIPASVSKSAVVPTSTKDAVKVDIEDAIQQAVSKAIESVLSSQSAAAAVATGAASAGQFQIQDRLQRRANMRSRQESEWLHHQQEMAKRDADAVAEAVALALGKGPTTSVYLASVTVTKTAPASMNTKALAAMESAILGYGNTSIPLATRSRGGAEFAPVTTTVLVKDPAAAAPTASPSTVSIADPAAPSTLSVADPAAPTWTIARGGAGPDIAATVASAVQAQASANVTATINPNDVFANPVAVAAQDAVKPEQSRVLAPVFVPVKDTNVIAARAPAQTTAIVGSLTGSNPGYVVVNAAAVSSSSKASTTTKASTSSKASSTKATSTVKTTSKATTSAKATSTAKTTSKASTSTKATSSAKPTSTSVPISTGGKQVLLGYWPDWTAGTLAPEAIDYSKYNLIFYAFALPNANYGLDFNYGSNYMLKRLVAAAKPRGTKVVLSIGGWGGSRYFSPAVSTPANRAVFIQNIKNVIADSGIDGVDFDWEYPNGEGAGNNILSQWDTTNFQTFLQEMRAAAPKAILSAAVAHLPWKASNGAPVASVARAAGALDYLMLMNYDVWGSSANPGPNAPLADLCGNSTMSYANAAAGVKQWGAAGMPASKIILGAPMYGYVSNSQKTTLIQRDSIEGHYTPSVHRQIVAGADVPSGRPGRYDARLQARQNWLPEGQMNFRDFISRGVIVKSSDGKYQGGSGWTRRWDVCSDTPFAYNGRQVITYDDPSSITDKGSFAAKAGLAGMGFWSIDGDTNDRALAAAARRGMGI